jgi:glutamate formiminotransferase
MEILELVPNVSEGRNETAIAEIAEGLASSPGTWLLDRHSDESHNRSVLTAVARPESVLTAALRLAERAFTHIDLRTHRGVHPRVGALDVLPLVPLEGFSKDGARELAEEIGRTLARSLEVPVFLYAESAGRPENRELFRLRKGGFEALASRMAASELVPDFGPRAPHPSAGAVAVGVRPILIAFNVELSTTAVEAARAIARRVRASGGGLPELRALGFELSHPVRAQVSMNLTDFRVTSLQAAFGAVEVEAGKLGVEVTRSEIVGLIPEAAAFEGMTAALRLSAPPGILEERISSAGCST